MIPSPVKKYMPRKRKTSDQCSAEPQTCQAAMKRATNGTRVTRPVMIRSRVSFSTGWMSPGCGPDADAAGAAAGASGKVVVSGMARDHRVT